MGGSIDWVVEEFRTQLVQVNSAEPGLLDEALVQREHEAKQAGLDITAEALAANDAVSAIVGPALWARQIGSTIDTTEVTHRLGITRQAVALRIRHHSLLAIPGRRSRRYPSWQFGGPDGVRPIVPTILRRWYQAEPEVEPATIAEWANTPVRVDGEDVRPAELIMSGGQDELLLRLLDDIVARRTQ